MKRVVSLLTRKNEASSSLKCRFKSFCDQSRDVFVPTRLRAYGGEFQEFLVDNRASTIHVVDGLTSILHARYCATFEMLGATTTSRLRNLREFVGRHRPPSPCSIDEEVASTLSMAVDDVAKRDSYREIVRKCFRNDEMADAFCQYERDLLQELLGCPTRASLQKRKTFEELHRASLRDVERSLCRDIVVLTPTNERIAAALGGTTPRKMFVASCVAFLAGSAFRGIF